MPTLIYNNMMYIIIKGSLCMALVLRYDEINIKKKYERKSYNILQTMYIMT